VVWSIARRSEASETRSGATLAGNSAGSWLMARPFTVTAPATRELQQAAAMERRRIPTSSEEYRETQHRLAWVQFVHPGGLQGNGGV
jgi:hypothetical protein